MNKADTRSFPGADIGSDRGLVLTTIKLKLKTKRFARSLHIRFDLEKFKDPDTADVLQAKVAGRLAALCVLDNNVDNLANGLKEVLLATAEKVLGRQEEEDSTLCHKRFSGSVRQDTAPQTTELHKQ